MSDDLDPRTLRPPANIEGGGLKAALSRTALRVARQIDGGHPIKLEYAPPDVRTQRFGWGNPPNAALQALLLRSIDRYRDVLNTIETYGPDLAQIANTSGAGNEPTWGQVWFTGVDAAALYSFIRARRPARYHEIGSGNSTLFAARAVRDGGLSTRIVSVDPQPRADVESVCTESIRVPLQNADASRIAAVEAGDVVLIDSSHYVLTNSDVVTFFLDVLPSLPAGVLVGIHDVFLPDDYPWWLSDRWFSEQYVLAGWLIGAGDRAKVCLPTHFVATHPSLRGELDAMWKRAGPPGVRAYGSCFWMET